MKIIKKFKPRGGNHCITNSLKQIFEFYNCPISEEMLFGLGSGLGFVYLNISNSPMVSCRIKPFDFEKNLTDVLNVDIKIVKTKKMETAFIKALKEIDEERPVMVYLDMAYLDYLNLGENNHFGGHSVVLFGYDKEEEYFYVSDRDNDDFSIHTPNGRISQDYHLVKFEEIEKSRNSSYKPFPANNKWVKFNFKNIEGINEKAIRKAIRINMENFLNPPAKLLGINGIEKFSKEIIKWKKFEDEKLKLAGITNYFMINEKGGTGGGAFRKMYGKFLIEASKFVSGLEEFGENYLQIAGKWDKIAEIMNNLYENADRNKLNCAKKIIQEIYNEEKEVSEELLDFV